MRIQVTQEEFDVISRGRTKHYDDKKWNYESCGEGSDVLTKLGSKFYDTKYIPGLFYGFEVGGNNGEMPESIHNQEEMQEKGKED